MPIFTGLDRAAITIVNDETALAHAKAALADVEAVGFDTESKPTFIKGEVSQGPHLIQLSTMSQVFLFPATFALGLAFAIEVVANGRIEKIGFGLKDDKTLFRKKYGVELVAAVDLAKKLIPLSQQKQQVGARAAVAMVLGMRLSKSAQQSNWANARLTEQQIHYAANDAYSAICICNKLRDEQWL